MDLNQQVQRLLDIEAIRDLPRRYAHCVWRKDAVGAAALFAEDGIMDTGQGEPMRGRAAIVSTYAPAFAGGKLEPFVHNHVIELCGDTATGVAYLDLRATLDGKDLAATGVYQDVYARSNDGWLFQSRKLIMHPMVSFGDSAPVGSASTQQDARYSLTLQEISDRLEIERLMVDYSTAIDSKNFDALDRIFVADAYIDYRPMGGIDGHFPEVKIWLAGALSMFPHHHHLQGNFDVKVSGDTATCRAICFNPMEMKLPGGGCQVMFFGLWYLNSLLRTADGWRICRLVEERCYSFNVPDGIGTGQA